MEVDLGQSNDKPEDLRNCLLNNDAETANPNSKDQNEAVLISGQQQPKSKQQTFLTEGSVSGSVFGLMQMALGTGVLILPSTARDSGIILAIILLVYSGLISLATLLIVAKCAAAQNINNYQDLTESYLGVNTRRALDVITIYFSWGVAVASEILFAETLLSLLYAWGVTGLYEPCPDPCTELTLTMRGTYIRWTINGCFVLANIPFCLMKTIGSFRYFSTFSVVCIIWLALTVLIQFFINLHTVTEDFSSTAWAIFDVKILTSLNIASFCFGNLQFLLTTYQELRNPNSKKIRLIIDLQLMGELIIYVSVLCFGYFQLYARTPDNILNIYPNSILMMTARVSILLSFFFSIGLTLIPARECALNLCRYIDSPVTEINDMSILDEASKEGDDTQQRKEEQAKLMKKQHQCYKTAYIIISLLLLLTSGVCAMFLPKIQFAISFLGGTCGTFLYITIPFAILAVHFFNEGKRQVDPAKGKSFKISGIFMIIATILISVAGLAGAIAGLVNEIKL